MRNTKNTIRLFSLLAGLALLSGCVRTLPIHDTDEKSTLIVNTLINCDSVNNYVNVTLANPQKIISYVDATVNCRVNGKLVAAAVYDAGRNTYALRCKFHPGDRIRLDVQSKDGKHHAWAEDVMPRPVNPDWTLKTDTVKNYPFSREGEDVSREDAYVYTVGFDEIAPNSFYRFGIQRSILETNAQHPQYAPIQIIVTQDFLSDYLCYMDPVMMEGHVYSPSSDLNFANANFIFNKMGVFNDHFFKNKHADFTVYDTKTMWKGKSDRRIRRSIDVSFSLQHISEAMYYYLKAVNTLQSSNYDGNIAFGGALKVPSNIHNGSGIMGLYAPSVKKRHLKSYYRDIRF